MQTEYPELLAATWQPQSTADQTALQARLQEIDDLAYSTQETSQGTVVQPIVEELVRHNLWRRGSRESQLMRLRVAAVFDHFARAYLTPTEIFELSQIHSWEEDAIDNELAKYPDERPATSWSAEKKKHVLWHCMLKGIVDPEKWRDKTMAELSSLVKSRVTRIIDKDEFGIDLEVEDGFTGETDPLAHHERLSQSQTTHPDAGSTDPIDPDKAQEANYCTPNIPQKHWDDIWDQQESYYRDRCKKAEEGNEPGMAFPSFADDVSEDWVAKMATGDGDVDAREEQGTVHVSQLNSEQRLCVERLEEQYHRIKTQVKEHGVSGLTDALKLIVYGEGGTGKSFLLKAFLDLIDADPDPLVKRDFLPVEKRSTAESEEDLSGQLRSKDLVMIMAPSAQAAINVRGTTIHTALSFGHTELPLQDRTSDNKLRDYDLAAEGDALQRLQQKNKYVVFYVCDEFGMVAADQLALMQARVRQAHATEENSPNVHAEGWASRSVVLFGHHAQLPPPGATRSGCLYSANRYLKKQKNRPPHSDWRIKGRSAYNEFKEVVVLREKKRQGGGESEESRVFCSILHNICEGKLTHEQYLILKKSNDQLQAQQAPGARTPFDGRDGVKHLCSTNREVDQVNLELLTGRDEASTKEAPVICSRARHAGPGKDWGELHDPDRRLGDRKDFKGLRKRLHLAKGAKVMCTSNAWLLGGVVNGLTGYVHEVIYPRGKGPDTCDLPVAILVKFPVGGMYRGPSYLSEEAGIDTTKWRVVKFTPQTEDGRSAFRGPDGRLKPPKQQRTLSRTQYTLTLADCITIHKSQGLTVDCEVLNLGSREMDAGLTYTAMSRARAMKDLFFMPWPSWDRFDRIKDLIADRQVHELVLEEKFHKTAVRHFKHAQRESQQRFASLRRVRTSPRVRPPSKWDIPSEEWQAAFSDACSILVPVGWGAWSTADPQARMLRTLVDSTSIGGEDELRQVQEGDPPPSPRGGQVMAVRDRLRVFLTKHVMPNLPSKPRGPFPGVQKNIPLKLDSTDAVKREKRLVRERKRGFRNTVAGWVARESRRRTDSPRAVVRVAQTDPYRKHQLLIRSWGDSKIPANFQDELRNAWREDVSRGANVFKAWKDATSREAKKKSKKARAQTTAAKQVAALQAALQKDLSNKKQTGAKRAGNEKGKPDSSNAGKGKASNTGKAKAKPPSASYDLGPNSLEFQFLIGMHRPALVGLTAFPHVPDFSVDHTQVDAGSTLDAVDGHGSRWQVAQPGSLDLSKLELKIRITDYYGDPARTWSHLIAWLKSNGFEVKLVTHRIPHGISQIGVSCGIVGTYVLVELKKGEDRDGFEFDFMNHDLGTTPVDGSTVFAGLQCLVNHELDFAPTGVALQNYAPADPENTEFGERSWYWKYVKSEGRKSTRTAPGDGGETLRTYGDHFR